MDQSTPVHTSTAPAHPDRVTGPRREVFVHVAIAATAILIIGMIAILCWKWINSVEPTTVMLRGNESFANTVIEIERKDEPFKMTVELKDENRWTERCFLLPGLYQIRLVQEGTVIVEREFVLQTRTPVMYDLSNMLLPKKEP